MGDLLSIGASGARAYQTALSTVSENIANVGVAGYTRRTTDLREVASNGGGLNARVYLDGAGVVAGGITRQADVYRAQAVRNAGADLGRTEAGATWLGRIETALTENDLGDRLTDFFTSARTLSADPTSIPARAVLLEKAGGAAAAFTQTGVSLARAREELDTSAKQSAATLNSLGASLAQVNDGLARAHRGSSQAAQLMDQRDLLTERMSGIVDVAVQYDEIGRVELRLGGGTGPVFVAGVETGNVSVRRNDEGAMSFAVQRAGGKATLTPNGGALAGAVEGAQRLAAATEALGQLARDFVTDVNAVQEGGADLDGLPGQALFALGATPTEIDVVPDDPRRIAAAVAGSPANSRDASNLVRLEAARQGGGWEKRLVTLVTDNAAALEQRKLVADAQGTIRDNAVAARDVASGVDLDNEAVELLRFQQAFQASSRVIQTARDILQSILEIR